MTKEQILSYLHEHKAEFQRKYGVEEIGLFGSFARGDAKAESDIDLLVSMPSTFDNVMNLKFELEESLHKKWTYSQNQIHEAFLLEMISKTSSMSDTVLMVLSTLEEIEKSLIMIQKRFAFIKTTDDFLANDENIERLDSIAMRLLAIGEGLKNIDKLTDGELLRQYTMIDWKKIKGLRDILSHHYFDINAEIIFDICTHKLDELLKVIQLIQTNLHK